MRLETIRLEEEGSLPGAHLDVYILDTPAEQIKITERPMVIICPGGGYQETSYREGEPVAMYFLQKGYHAAVLWYSTGQASYPTALLELGRSMGVIRERAGEWHVDRDRIYVQGSSAGGHLAGCLGVFWDRPFLARKLGLEKEEIRPSGLILSYPVISADPAISHTGSFRTLLKEAYEEKKEELSLEKQVSCHTPSCFLWHTFSDATVPVENSLRMAEKLHSSGVKVELHIFQEGIHGLGTASELTRRPDGRGVQKECQCWMDLAGAWIEQQKTKD